MVLESEDGLRDVETRSIDEWMAWQTLKYKEDR